MVHYRVYNSVAIGVNNIHLNFDSEKLLLALPREPKRRPVAKFPFAITYYLRYCESPGCQGPRARAPTPGARPTYLPAQERPRSLATAQLRNGRVHGSFGPHKQFHADERERPSSS
jgi:hypothetical protein